MKLHSRRGVLAAVDGSPDSRAAAALAAREAVWRGEPLKVVYVDRWSSHAQDSWPGDARERRAAALELLATITSEIDLPDLAVSSEALEGPIVPALLTEAASASLAVVGRRGDGIVPGIAAGPVARQLTAHAHSPVIVAAGNDPPDAQQGTSATDVVAAVDSPGGAGPILQFAAGEARCRAVALRVIHVWHEPPPSPADSRKPVAYEYDRAYSTAMAALTEMLGAVQDKNPDVKITGELVRDPSAVSALIRESSRSALMVIGSRGCGGFRGLALGSVSDTLVQHAACPLAVVHSGL